MNKIVQKFINLQLFLFARKKIPRTTCNTIKIIWQNKKCCIRNLELKFMIIATTYFRWGKRMCNATNLLYECCGRDVEFICIFRIRLKFKSF